MRAWQKGALIVGTTVGIASASLWVLEPDPPKPETPEFTQQEVERQIDDLADSNERSQDRWRDELEDGINAENERKLTPHERRPRLRVPFP